jgi:hypothetical protein
MVVACFFLVDVSVDSVRGGMLTMVGSSLNEKEITPK